MKSLHVCFGFQPDPVAGTEIYVGALARELKRLGDTAVVAAPAPAARSYDWNGVPVRRFPFQPPPTTAALYDEGDELAAQELGRLVDREEADVVHVHGLTHACSLRLVREAKRRVPVVFTYHTPTVSCSRGTLMEHGTTPCDGVVGPLRCAACVLEQHGAPSLLARTVARTPAALARAVQHAPVPQRLATALQIPELVASRGRVFHDTMREMDRIIALCGWTEELLLANGIPREKVVRMKQANCLPIRSIPAPEPSETLRLLFMGRLHRDKGIAVMLDALSRVAGPRVTLDVYGTVQDDEGRALEARLRDAARRDPRVRVHEPVVPDAVPEVLARHDMMIVPSQWFEVAPLVIVEAFSAGMPVMGSALGGVPELVHDGVNGVLVSPFDSAAAWAAAISRLATNRSVLQTLRQGVTPPMPMEAAAVSLRDLYARLLEQPSVRLSA